MTDPYKVLGIPPSASDEQVKAAYRELAKKYHPDNFSGNPLADLASEKMQEINQAYDIITNQRKARQSQSSSYGSATSASSSAYSSSASQFGDIRRMINAGRISEAQELLDGVPASSRDAEWHFLKGTIYYSRGWLDDALRYFQQAHTMNPQNQEYAASYNQLMWQRQTGRTQYGAGGYQSPNSMGGCNCCDICAAMYCANCCMDCCGGGC